MQNKDLYLIQKLDLSDFISNFSTYLSRQQNISLAGDRALHLRYIQELDKYDFTPPEIIKPCDEEIKLLKKSATINLEAIISLIKTLRYLKYLKSIGFKNSLKEWVENIKIPQEIDEIDRFFDKKYELLDFVDVDLANVNNQIAHMSSQIKRSFANIISKNSVQPYLVDSQIHIVNGEEALLFRGGFNKIIPSKIISRSSSGFFYIIPYSIVESRVKLSRLRDEREEVIYKITKQISGIFKNNISFLEFSQRSFNRFDGYQSRIMFARRYDLEFILPSNSSNIILDTFSHPAIENPVSINLDFRKTLLIVTGVNAGGKTILLKSILTCVFLAKQLLPMNINAQKSSIGSFEQIIPIIEDPQNVAENISTFAGRMLTFSKLFNTKKSLLIGVDEIELGTDSNEAASLFEAILQELITKNNKIIVTTHHKKLASAMAKNKNVELLAALYNEQEQRPTYRFLQGTIGRSYAFETALRYNIPNYIIDRAKQHYGDAHEDLSGLIEKSTNLEYELLQRKEKLDKELEKIDNIKNDLQAQEKKMQEQYKKQKEEMQNSLNEAIEYARKAIKVDMRDAHKLLNKANKASKNIQGALTESSKKEKFVQGDMIRYNSAHGHIVSIKSSFALIQSDNFRLKVPLRDLKKSNKDTKQKVKLDIEKPKNTKLSLDLHGIRADEALDKLDNFLSNAAMNDLSEVVIYHGMGSGRLAHMVKEFLDIHPCILEYKDAPQNMGGYGATIAILSIRESLY